LFTDIDVERIVDLTAINVRRNPAQQKRHGLVAVCCRESVERAVVAM
jgi:hypothetical protein